MRGHSGKYRQRNWNVIRDKETEMDRLPAGGSPLWAMIYPADYGVGMSSLGYQSIISEMRKLGVGVERFFPGPLSGMSVETGRNILDFPLISASVAYEPDLLSLLSVFMSWGLAPGWKERSQAGQPVFGVGGALSYINPFIFYDIADYVVLGDGEPVVEHLVRECRRYMSHGDRKRLWEGLAEHGSIYVPPIHNCQILNEKPVHRKKSVLADLDLARGKSLWITSESVFGRTILVELQRGCPRACRYCTIPASFGPVRTRSVERVLEDVAAVKDLEDVQVGLVTPEAGDYPELSKVLRCIRSTKRAVSFASLRVDNIKEEMMQALVESGRYTITVAPEAGNDRLRGICGKKFSNEEIIEKMVLAKKTGIRQAKLYFMVGLPGETLQDVETIAGLCNDIRSRTALKLSASVGVFVPKPMSPWENENIAGHEEASEKIRKLKELFLGNSNRGLSIRIQEPKESMLEYRISWRGLGTDLPPASYRKAICTIKNKIYPEKDLLREQLGLLGFKATYCLRGDWQ